MLEGKRIVLSSAALELLEVERIKKKGAHFKLNESKLASAIIELFCLKYLLKEGEFIETKFFDRKIYLKTLIENSKSEEELSMSFNEFFNKSKKIKEKLPRKN